MSRKKKKKTIRLDPCRNPLEQGHYNYLKRHVSDLHYETSSLPYVLPKKYIPDFQVTTKSGRKFFIEVKGYLRPEDRTKMIAVKFANPDVDIRLLFAKNQKLNKNSKTTYMDWAKKHNFEAAVGKIPKNWLT